MVGQVVGGPFGWNLSNKKAITKADIASKKFVVKCKNLARGNSIYQLMSDAYHICSILVKS